jgi:hypothetical protein
MDSLARQPRRLLAGRAQKPQSCRGVGWLTSGAERSPRLAAKLCYILGVNCRPSLIS